MLIYLSKIPPFSLPAINIMVVELHNEYTIEWTHKRHMAQSLWVCSQSLSNNKEYKSFEELYNNMKNNKTKEDDKTSDEIIQDTLEKFKKL